MLALLVELYAFPVGEKLSNISYGSPNNIAISVDFRNLTRQRLILNVSGDLTWRPKLMEEGRLWGN